ncbi:MAG TPA: DUF6776 family protein [Casimicrobiaceae bacterium]|nr:DUF6776 family protein [Casimicrobiaceae bacterium]
MVTIRAVGRRLRKTFGVSASRMAVRIEHSWRLKVPLTLLVIALVAGMWWWGFDFGRLLDRPSRAEVEAAQTRLAAEVLQLKEDNSSLRARATALESDLAIARGAQGTLSKQTLDLQSENTQMKEELAFLQQLFSDSGKPGTISIQRLSAERASDDAYRYSLLIVRGGKPSDEFSGQLTVEANLVDKNGPMTIELPGDQPEHASELQLKFKYYQRVEGTISVPPGSELKSLQAKVIEQGQASPKATRSLNIS